MPFVIKIGKDFVKHTFRGPHSCAIPITNKKILAKLYTRQKDAQSACDRVIENISSDWIMEYNKNFGKSVTRYFPNEVEQLRKDKIKQSDNYHLVHDIFDGKIKVGQI